MPDKTGDKSVNSDLQSDAKDERNASKETSSSTPTHRLGILSLGWHAHELTMPASLLASLRANNATTIPNIIPLLGYLSAQDPSIKSTYLCHASVQYITKLPREGSFCGYRNIQMLISYLLGSKSEFDFGSVSESEAQSKAFPFPDDIPSIPHLQDLIEAAWDRGFNASGRIETGGICNTRKHIGTPEAQALFRSLGIPCQVARFQSKGREKAFDLLLEYVERHFTTVSISADANADASANANANAQTNLIAANGKLLHQTSHPPIYLQRPRHSLTIVGTSIHNSGTRNLLVLDPGYRPSPRMIRAAQAAEAGCTFEKRVSLRPYRKGKWGLGGYREFEVLTFAS